jgi:GNAT superfamily N-acetyltransferase
MHQIHKSAFKEVRTIFKDLEIFQPMCTAVLEGVWPGQVWVDDEASPRSGLLITFLSGGGAAWCFLAGDPSSPSFNTAVNKAIFEEEVAGDAVGTFLFTCHPMDWDGGLSQVGHPRQPAPMSRRHYVCRQLDYEFRPKLPAGVTLQPMDTDLLEGDEIKIHPEVETTLKKWDSIKDVHFQDYGFVAVSQRQVVAWATVDFVVGGRGDLGFETLSEYRRRGLGSAVAAAALEHGLANGIEVHWTCAEDNIGSQRTAEKLGLERDRDYHIYLFSLDLLTHNAQLAYTKLAAGYYQEAIDLYESLFAQDANLPAWAYFDTAQACAALGQGENALKYLRMAVKQGWTAVDVTEGTEEFEFLSGTPEWETVIESMRQKEKDG